MKFLINNILLIATGLFTLLFFLIAPKLTGNSYLGVQILALFFIIISGIMIKLISSKRTFWILTFTCSIAVLFSTRLYFEISYSQNTLNIEKIANKYKSLSFEEIEQQFINDSINDEIKYFSLISIATNRTDIIYDLKELRIGFSFEYKNE